jgi:PadR family transcriptional regulator PadR
MPRRPHTSRQAISLFRLLIVARAEWVHGYQLCETLGFSAGTLYPLLMRLADQGLLEAKWEESPIAGRPRRHLYRLTNAGIELARARIAEFTPRDAARLATI